MATDTKSRLEESMAEDAKIDAQRPTLAQRGAKRMYHVGLVDGAPFEAITVPTVVLRGTIRGKAVSVPKKTARVHMGPKGILVHDEAANVGAFEELYDIEVEGFLKYIDTHVFRKTSDYEIPEVNAKGKATGKMLPMWKAEIDNVDPSKAVGSRSIHDEQELTGEVMSKYVWIVPAELDTHKKPLARGSSDTVAVARANKTFFWDNQKAKVVEPPTGGGQQNTQNQNRK